MAAIAAIASTPVSTPPTSSAFGEGFENGADGWEGGANMALDTAVAHTCGSSARLVVADPTRDPVYITRKVPIEAGAYYTASCFVRTENVVEAQGAKWSVGAGLIVEWANRDGAWMKSGQYACGLRGTEDWRRVECNSLKAPDEAGFAILFLTLRDAGTAWFDDVSLERVDVSIEKVSPGEGATFANNCPFFEWKSMPGIRSYTLELSQDPSFAPGATLSFAAGGLPRFQLREPLEPGVWHWRVVAHGLQDSHPRSFTQTAPQDRDCLPPLVATRAARVTRGDEPFAVEVEGDDLAVVLLLFGAETAIGQQADSGKRTMARMVPPAGGWPEGLTEGRLIASDASGTASTTDFWLLNESAPANAVAIGADGFYHENGQRIFPLMIYEVEPGDMADIREAGIEVVHNYRWEKTQDDASCRAWLDACATNGLRAFIGFDRGIRTGRGMVQGNLACVARRVGALASHPALFCWYLFDEPEWLNQFITAESMIEFADLVRALDPFHPVVVTTWGEQMKSYRRSWDTHWTQAYGKPADVDDQLDEHFRFLDNDSPVTLVACCNDTAQGERRRRGVEPDPTKFARDRDHMRACAFLSIVKGCNGLAWWWFGRGSTEYYSAAQCPPAWEDMKGIVAELRCLRPMLAADGTVESGSARDGDARVKWWLKRAGGRTVFIAVNTADHPVTVTIDTPEGRRRLDLRRYEVRVEGL